MESPAFHRTVPGPWTGKCTETIKTRISARMLADLQTRAHSLGLTDAELLREIIAVSLYGVDHVASMHRERLMAAAGLGPEVDHA